MALIQSGLALYSEAKLGSFPCSAWECIGGLALRYHAERGSEQMFQRLRWASDRVANSCSVVA